MAPAVERRLFPGDYRLRDVRVEVDSEFGQILVEEFDFTKAAGEELGAKGGGAELSHFQNHSGTFVKAEVGSHLERAIAAAVQQNQRIS